MKKIVIYYSYTGNTEKIATLIAEKLNCDILKLEPNIPYSSDYQTVVDGEKDNDKQVRTIEIKEINKNINDYDEIIIGSPVWWYTITPVIRTFLKENDLSGKTIIPFATNAGWLGDTFKEIKKICKNSYVKNEMNIIFKSYTDILITSMDEINEWVDKIKKDGK